MTTLIQQRTPYDCSIASLAMAMGRTYEDVLETVGDLFHPVQGMRAVGSALKLLGLKQDYDNGLPTDECDFVSLHRDWCIHPALFRTWIWGRRSLVSVPSLNINDADALHMVYYDGKRVYDPSLFRTYDSWTKLLPNEAIIFRDKSA